MKWILKTTLVLTFIFLSHSAFAATLYIDTLCGLNGNGTAPDCATSGGGAGAYNTGASWSNGANNTTYIKRGTTVSNLATIISSSGQIITAYGPTNLPNPIISKSASTFTISISGNDVTFDGIDFTGSQSSAVVSTVATNTIIRNGKIYSNRGNGIGMRFNTGSSNGTVENMTIYDIDDDGVGIAANASPTGTFTIKNLTCYEVDKLNFGGDCIQAYDGTPANVAVIGGNYTKETPTKQAIRYNGTGNLSVTGSVITLTSGASATQGISVDGTSTAQISNVYINAQYGAPAIWLHNNGTTTVSGSVILNGAYGVWSSHNQGLLNVYNNTITGALTAGIYHTTDGIGGTIIAKNNYIDAPLNIADASASSTTYADYNRYGSGSFWDDGFTKATLALWQASKGQDQNSAVANPYFVGGVTPITKYGYRLSSSSTFRGAGTRVGNYTDMLGRPFSYTPSIGAFEVGSRDFSVGRLFRLR